MTITAFPLSWPAGWKRTEPVARTFGRFGTSRTRSSDNWRSKEDITVYAATVRLRQELERAFTGFTALPAPDSAPGWQSVLELQDHQKPDRDDIEKAYRRMASKHHPDRGGSADRMAAINKARDQALAWLEQSK